MLFLNLLRGAGTDHEQALKRWEVGVLSAGGLVIGLGLSAAGLTTVCHCPAQLVGQPSTCSCPASPEALAGIGLALASAVALVLSLLVKPRTSEVK